MCALFFRVFLADVMAQLLSVYMNADGKKPLPQADEVLICNNETSEEEVDFYYHLL